MSKPTTQEIIAEANELEDELFFDCICVRTQDQPFELGPIDHISHVWVDGDETDEELDGISATSIRFPSDVRMHASDHAWSYYPGEHVALIGTNDYNMGEDAGEIITRDAEVVYVFC